ncbi:MAG: hypothetical protein LQ343_003625 [Gyalolechia ehrenbergii]|nr:MAG: hypothetical protein LQ343_003625 [Gyalolechia ehrenbergii]
MSRNYRISSLFLLSSLLSTLTAANPHPQRGNRHRHVASSVVETTTNAPIIAAQPTVTQLAGGGSDLTTLPIDPLPTTAGGNSRVVSSSSSSTSTGGGKRGLAYNSSSPSLSSFSKTGITWSHDWNSAPSDSSSQFMFVPTLWSDQSPHSDNWDQNAAGHEYLMSFNEPDIVAQANMDVNSAVDKYKSLVFPKRTGGVKIGAPSVTSGFGKNEAGIPMGTSWLSQFLDQCNDDSSCQANLPDHSPSDFVSGHWYGCPGGSCTVQDDINSFNKYISDLVSTAQDREVWIPEFQRYGDVDGQKQFLESVLPTLDSNSAVTHYAYFMVVDGIMTTNGQPNELGRTFAG